MLFFVIIIENMLSNLTQCYEHNNVPTYNSTSICTETIIERKESLIIKYIFFTSLYPALNISPILYF